MNRTTAQSRVTEVVQPTERRHLPRLLKGNEAAELLAISTTKLAELTKDGDVPCVRLGRAVRYDLADLSVLIESRKTRK